LQKLAEITKNENKNGKVAANCFRQQLVFTDIAGLVKGASKGEGLGNKFLSHIREVDAIAQVVRYFKSADVTHIEGNPNPENDFTVVNMELIFADLQTLEKQQPPKMNATKEDIVRYRAIEKLRKLLNDGFGKGRRVIGGRKSFNSGPSSFNNKTNVYNC